MLSEDAYSWSPGDLGAERHYASARGSILDLVRATRELVNDAGGDDVGAVLILIRELWDMARLVPRATERLTAMLAVAVVELARKDAT